MKNNNFKQGQSKNGDKNQYEYEGPISRATKMPRKPNFNEGGKIPFDQWDWQKEDPDFYEQFHKLPDSIDPDISRQVRWNRYNQSLNPGGNPYDLRPRTFFKKMRFEIFLFAGGILMGLFCKHMF